MNKIEKSRIETFSYRIINPQDFDKDDYIHLWQYFSDRADMLKDRLWTMATWLFGLNSALLGFIFGTPLIAFDSVGSAVRAPAFVLALALAGCVLCLYAFVLIYDYGKHIQRNWDRAGRLSAELPLVEYALGGKAKVEQKANLPPIAKHLMVFTFVYLVAFLTIAAFAFQRL